jgi:thioredoxin 1
MIIMALEINKSDFQAEVLEAKETVLVDFWAPWCGPCRMQAPVLEKFAEENPAVKVVKVNVLNSLTVGHLQGLWIYPLCKCKNGGTEGESDGKHRVTV